MSEYQYYEFRAIDRPLTETQKAKISALSSRAHVTSHVALLSITTEISGEILNNS